MSYWFRFWVRLWKDFAAATGEHMIGIFLAVGTLFYQIRYGIIHSGDIHASYWSLGKPYAFLFGAFFLWHLIRTPYLLHVEDENLALDAIDARVKEREGKPEFKITIDCVVRSVFNEAHFFVHTHMVNLTGTSASVRTVSLKNHTTGESLPVLPFGKCFAYRNGETKLSASLAPDGTFSRSESRIKDEIPDILESLRLPLIRGEGKSGWLLFQKAYSLQEAEAPLLSLHVVDAFGGTHDSERVEMPYEFGRFCK